MKFHSRLQICLLLSFFLLVFNDLPAQLIAFPGAEGAGKYVSGGRGNTANTPKVFEVTTLDDNSTSASTPGTFRYAVTNNSPAAPYRIIVFRVSGVIHLYAQLNLTRANTTIAGQTAPGGGIVISDFPIYISNNNIIIRYVRFRLGDKNQPASLGNDDAFGDNGSPRQKIMVDHCTMSWSNDEVTSIYDGDSLTIQWCMMSEPLDSSYHDEGSGVQQHAYGGIQGGKHASLHHNIYAHCRGRMPRFNGIRTGYADTTDFRNNIIYNWADYNVNGGEGGSYNVVNNYYKYGLNTPSTSSNGVNRRSMLIQPYKQASPVIAYGKYYLTGNYCFNSSTVTGRNWLGASFASGSFTDSTNSKVTVPFNCININTQSASEAYQSVLKEAGCILPYRDTLDQRIVSNIINGTGKLINCQGGFPRGTAYATTLAAWPFLPAGFTPVDTDHDGMPDLWETQRGLNAASTADLNLYTSKTGYSNVETYLNGDTITAPGILNSCVSSKTIYAANSGAWIHLKDTSYGNYNSSLYQVSTDTNNLIASVYDNIALGNIAASYYTTSTIRTNASGKSFLNRNITISSALSGAASTAITVRLYISKKEYDDLRAADATITSPSDLRIVRSNDNSCITALPTSIAVYQPTATGVFGSYRNGYYLDFQTNNLGTFFITGYNSLLPVKLISFNATADKDNVKTFWNCNQEFQVKDYEVQKSKDASDFALFGKVAALNTTASQQSYQLTDNNPLVGKSYYRLRVNDFDGHFQFSNIVPVYFGGSNTLNVYPNPANDFIFLDYNGPMNSTVYIRILNDLGQECLLKKQSSAGFSRIVDIKKLSPGGYTLELINGCSISRVRFSKLK